MSKKNRKDSSSKKKKTASSSEIKKKKKTEDQAPVITLEDIDAMSSDDEQDVPPMSEWSKDAKRLHQAIAAGSFNHLIKEKSEEDDDDDDDDEIEEVVLGDSSSENDEPDKQELESQSEEGENENDEDEEESDDDDDGQEQEEKLSKKNQKEQEEEDSEDDDSESDESEQSSSDEDEDDDDEEEDEDNDDNKNARKKTKHVNEKNTMTSKALSVITGDLQASKAGWPFAEKFDVMPSTPLPFGKEHGDPDSNPLDIHDDLKREVAFYNLALEAVKEARTKCKQENVPFSRPDDYFAEMVKTDDHMAKVKDRLIFESKKIDAVARRKSNREQKLRAKESHANRLAEKAKRKKNHLQQVEEWANNVASNRGDMLNDNDDAKFLRRMGGGGANKKRQAADRKYGHGGKRGRFKQNDRKTLDDTSSFNPRGNFAGGMKYTGKNGSGANRKGKRARDANRARHS